MLAVAFVAGSFVASPELRAFASTIANDVMCTGCVGTSDLAGNAVTSAKIKDGNIQTTDIAPSAIGSARIKDNDVKAQDLAPDSVGASEIIGVTHLVFGQCSKSVAIAAGSYVNFSCTVPGASGTNSVIATTNFGGSFCPVVTNSFVSGEQVNLGVRNVCGSAISDTIGFNLILFKKG